MFSDGHTMTGSGAQEHFRALCIYLGAPLGARHGDQVLIEAIEHLADLPADDITLEAAITANRIEVLDAMEDSLGHQPYRLRDIKNHRLWLRLYHLRPGPEVRARIADRVLSANKRQLTSSVIADLCVEAAVHYIPEMLQKLFSRELMTDDLLLKMLGDVRIIESPAFQTLDQMLPARLAPELFTEKARRGLTRRHDDATSCKAVALLAKTGMLAPTGRKEFLISSDPICIALINRLNSAHGRLFLMRDLPAPEVLIATPAHKVDALVAPLLLAG